MGSSVEVVSNLNSTNTGFLDCRSTNLLKKKLSLNN